jgi:hypothetical protein
VVVAACFFSLTCSSTLWNTTKRDLLPRWSPTLFSFKKWTLYFQHSSAIQPRTLVNKTKNDENANESMVRNVGIPNEMDIMKPPKLESKCNCTIMWNPPKMDSMKPPKLESKCNCTIIWKSFIHSVWLLSPATWRDAKCLYANSFVFEGLYGLLPIHLCWFQFICKKHHHVLVT